MTANWHELTWAERANVEKVRELLDRDADPNFLWGDQPLLHRFAEIGSPEVVTELAKHVADVEVEFRGRSALWWAVFENRVDIALALVGAGADPWRPMMSGWSPGRLALAGPNPELFPLPPGIPALSDADKAAVAESHRLLAAMGNPETEGLGAAMVAGIDAAEVAQRLGASALPHLPVDDSDSAWWHPYLQDNEDMRNIGVTEVPGGCVITQHGGYAPANPPITVPLSRGTVCYGLYGNAASGFRGYILRDEVDLDTDLSPCGMFDFTASPDEVLLSYFYRRNPLAYVCAFLGLQLTDDRPFTGQPDVWLKLP